MSTLTRHYRNPIITFSWLGATYTLTNHGANEDGNVTGDLDIQYPGGSVFIEGASAGTTIIDGDLADRVIDLHNGTLTLSDLYGEEWKHQRIGTTRWGDLRPPGDFLIAV